MSVTGVKAANVVSGAHADTATIGGDATLINDLLANDEDADGDDLALTPIGEASNGMGVSVTNENDIPIDPDVGEANDAPEFVEVIFELPEEQSNNQIVGKVTAVDPEGISVRYKIIDGNFNDAFKINDGTGQIIVNKNWEIGAQPYNLTIEATDGVNTITTTVSATPTALEPVPPTDLPADAPAGSIVINNAVEFENYLRSGEYTHTVYLAPGDYGYYKLSPYQYTGFDGNVTFKSLDQHNPAVFDQIFIEYANNVTFDGVDFRYTATENSTWLSTIIRADHVSNLTINDAIIQGSPSIVGSDLNALQSHPSGLIIGRPAGIAFSAKSSTNITISNSVAYDLQSGVSAGDTDGFNVLNSEIYNTRGVPIKGFNVDNVTIDGNFIHNIIPAYDLGDHGDFVHFFTKPGQGQANLNYEIKNNVFLQEDGLETLGIYLDDDGHNYGYENVLIENNLLSIDNFIGVLLEHVVNGEIRSNTLLQDGAVPGHGPTIVINETSRDLLVEDNILSSGNNGLIISTKNPNPETIVENNNLYVQNLDPNQENYGEDIFVNALVSGSEATLDDLMALPDGVVQTLGVGATFTRFDTSPDTLRGIATSTTGTGFGLNVVELEIDAVYGPAGKIDLVGAQIVWDFGDGQGSDGSAVSHTYEKAGIYDAVATVTLDDGSTLEIPKTVIAQNPLAFFTNSESEGYDISDYSNAISISEGVTFIGEGADNTAVKLNGGTVVYERTADLSRNDAFTIMVSFKKEDLSDQGVVMSGPGFDFSVGGDELWSYNGIETRDELSRDWFKIRDLEAINNTDWHDLAMTYSSETGVLALYLDGQEIGRREGLQGGHQQISDHLSLSLGSKHGNSFDGLIDNVAFYRGAMSAEHIATHDPATIYIHGGDSIIPQVPDLPEQAAPVAHDNLGALGYEDGPVTLNVLNNDTDINGDSLTIVSTSDPENGFVINRGINVIYYPDPDFSGIDTFTYTISDGNGGESTATVRVDVQASNDRPVVSSTLFEIPEDAVVGAVVGQLQASDVDGDVLSYSIATGNDHGIFEVDMNGVIRIADNSNLDFEINDEHTLKIFVDDGTVKVPVEISINVNEIADIVTDDPNFIDGSANVDRLYGTRKGDLILGRGNDDRIEGKGGHDILMGNGGRDFLIGGAGNDTLEGGIGKDELKGNAGADVFVFDERSARDVVHDFAIGTDRVEVPDNAQATLISSNTGHLTVEYNGAWLILRGHNLGDATLDDLLWV